MHESTVIPDPQPAAATDPENSPEITPEITVYWRPGCGFCGRLLRQLERHEIVHRRINIWDDEAAAATVRSIARGHETVPTVVVGRIGLVNPSVQQIIGAVQSLAADTEPVG